MRSGQRLMRAAGAGVLVLAVVALWGGGSDGSPSAAAQAPPAGAATRIAFVDVYALSERIIDQPEMKAARETVEQKWKGRIESINAELDRMQNSLKVKSPSDPAAQQIMAEGRAKQEELQRTYQDRSGEIEKLTSEQLVTCYQRVRDAAKKIADREGYTHVASNRSQDRKIVTETVALTLQELLARPFITFPEQDDLTKRVATDLKLPEVPVPAADKPLAPTGATGGPGPTGTPTSSGAGPTGTPPRPPR